MRTQEQISADAEPRSAFSNGTEYDMWADRWCYSCVNDDANTEKWCPILSVALLGSWPKEWLRRRVYWQIGDGSGEYDAVDSCTEFEERREPRDGDPEPEPEPAPVIEGQVDMFEVFADQIVEQASERAAMADRDAVNELADLYSALDSARTTWRHNRFIGVHHAVWDGVIEDRAAAERNAETCRRVNPGDDVGVVTRFVTPWVEVGSIGGAADA